MAKKTTCPLRNVRVMQVLATETVHRAVIARIHHGKGWRHV